MKIFDLSLADLKVVLDYHLDQRKSASQEWAMATEEDALKKCKEKYFYHNERVYTAEKIIYDRIKELMP